MYIYEYSVVMASLTFPIFGNFCLFCLSLAKDLSIILMLSEKHHLDLLIASITFLFSVLMISTQIFIISFLLLNFSLYWSSRDFCSQQAVILRIPFLEFIRVAVYPMTSIL